MKLKPGCGAEYKKRHDALWPEMAEALRGAGLMAPLMETNADTSPVMEPLEEMFYFPG